MGVDVIDKTVGRDWKGGKGRGWFGGDSLTQNHWNGEDFFSFTGGHAGRTKLSGVWTPRSKVHWHLEKDEAAVDAAGLVVRV